MKELSPQRRKVVALCAVVACMAGGPAILKGHSVLLRVWIGVMAVAVVVVIVEFAKLKRQGL